VGLGRYFWDLNVLVYINDNIFRYVSNFWFFSGCFSSICSLMFQEQSLLKILVSQLSFATKIQLHATHATTNLCSCLRQVAYDMQLHATLCMQHVYTVLVYMFVHTYQSNVVTPCVQHSL